MEFFFASRAENPAAVQEDVAIIVLIKSALPFFAATCTGVIPVASSLTKSNLMFKTACIIYIQFSI